MTDGDTRAVRLLLDRKVTQHTTQMMASVFIELIGLEAIEMQSRGRSCNRGSPFQRRPMRFSEPLEKLGG